MSMKTIYGIPLYREDYEYEDFDTKETKEGFTTYIDFEDVPNHMKAEFNKWMYGQTMPMIEGCKGAIYSWDWERWYELKTKGIPTYFD
jgi:hypothetical protein